MSKRGPTFELNHDNWNDEDQPEEAGTFQKAAPDVIEKRVMKSAKRRSTGVSDSPVAGKSPFAGLGSFKMASSSSSSPFSFLNSGKDRNDESSSVKNCVASNSTESTPKKDPNTSSLKPSAESAKDKNKDSGEGNARKSTDYYSKLRGLNESVSDWIRLHVNQNPFCILTPIFKDYERHLKEIEETRKDSSEATLKDSDQNKMTSKEIGSSSVFSKDTENEHDKNSIEASSKNKNNVPEKVTGFTFCSADNQSKGGTSKFVSIFANAHAHSEKDTSEKSTTSTQNSVKETNPVMVNPFTSQLGSKTSLFGTGASTTASVGFSFGSGSTATMNASESKKEDDDYQPPKPVFTIVQEEGAAYSKRCKVFVRKDSSYQERGIGTLYLKPLTSEGKTQLIVRADTSLGNLLINCLMNSTMSPQKMGGNNVMLICLPTPESKPPPVPILLKVKTSEDADELLEKLKEFIEKIK